MIERMTHLKNGAAVWLRPIVPEVKVQHVRAGIVYWVPK